MEGQECGQAGQRNCDDQDQHPSITHGETSQFGVCQGSRHVRTPSRDDLRRKDRCEVVDALRPGPSRSRGCKGGREPIGGKRLARFATQPPPWRARRDGMPLTRKAIAAAPPGDDERGTALVEFALVLPLVLMLAFGVVTAGLTYNHKIDLTHAAREGARYGATLAQLQCSGSPNGSHR